MHTFCSTCAIAPSLSSLSLTVSSPTGDCLQCKSCTASAAAATPKPQLDEIVLRKYRGETTVWWQRHLHAIASVSKAQWPGVAPHHHRHQTSNLDRIHSGRMGTNVFNSSAMAAVAAAALGTGATRRHHSAVGGQSTMLFTPTPVAGTPLGLATSPTAFPFPPPSPLFLPALNLLQQSPQVPSHSHLQPLSPWISPSPIPSLSTFGMPISGKYSESTEFASDDNNNDLISSSAHSRSPSTPPKSKYRSTEQELAGQEAHQNRLYSLNSAPKELKGHSNGLFEFDKDKSLHDSSRARSYSPRKAPSSHNMPGKLICFANFIDASHQ